MPKVLRKKKKKQEKIQSWLRDNNNILEHCRWIITAEEDVHNRNYFLFLQKLRFLSGIIYVPL